VKAGDYRELLIGCGRARVRNIVTPGNASTQWRGLTTLDSNPAVSPDVVWTLDARPWPFEDNTFDEIHAYEVLEHLGRQGDIVSFFHDFGEAYRVLKPGGYLVGTTPSRYSKWLWGDPGHTRAIMAESSLVFLAQPAYAQCDGPHPTTMSDYRHLWRGDFEILRDEDDKMPQGLHRFLLQAIKPAREASYSGR